MRWIIILIILAVFTGCNTTIEKDNKVSITVSILPQKYIVEQIAGDHFNINVLVPEGNGPETYEPTALQMQEVSKSKMYFMTGLLDFEQGWLTNVGKMHADLKIINTSESIELLTGHVCDDHHHDHSHMGVDPHIWLSLKAVKIQALNIFNQLVELDPLNKEIYNSNFHSFYHLLDSVDSIITQRYSDSGPQGFMIYHPSLSYYANDYGIEQISIELDGKEPSPAHMRELIDIATEKKINTIFYSEQFDKRSAETIAKQLSIKLAGFNPLAENIVENLLSITDQIITSAN